MMAFGIWHLPKPLLIRLKVEKVKFYVHNSFNERLTVASRAGLAAVFVCVFFYYNDYLVGNSVDSPFQIRYYEMYVMRT